MTPWWLLGRDGLCAALITLDECVEHSHAVASLAHRSSPLVPRKHKADAKLSSTSSICPIKAATCASFPLRQGSFPQCIRPTRGGCHSPPFKALLDPQAELAPCPYIPREDELAAPSTAAVPLGFQAPRGQHTCCPAGLRRTVLSLRFLISPVARSQKPPPLLALRTWLTSEPFR